MGRLIRGAWVPAVLLLAVTLPASAGEAASNGSGLPQVRLIVPDGDAIWFVAPLFGKSGYVFRLDRPSGKWQTFCPATGQRFGRIVETRVSPRAVRFIEAGKVTVFDKDGQTWRTEAVAYPDRFRPNHGTRIFGGETVVDTSEFDLERRTVRMGAVTYILKGRTADGRLNNAGILKLEEGQVTALFDLPQPTAADLERLRPDLFPEGRGEGGSGIRNEIGPFFVEGRRIWFGVTFSGAAGVGGLGTFDTATETWKVRYPPELLDSAVSAIGFDGREIWIGTQGSGGSGGSPGRGLVRYDPQEGSWTAYSPENSGLGGFLISALARVGGDLWLATERGLTRFDPARGAWTNYAIERVLVRAQAEVYRGTDICLRYDRSRPGESRCGRAVHFSPLSPIGSTGVYRLLERRGLWAGPAPASPRFEIELPLDTTGWVRRQEVDRQAFSHEGIRWDGMAVLRDQPSDDGWIIALTGRPDRLKVLEDRGEWVRVGMRSGWVDQDQVVPMMTAVAK